MLSQLNRQQDDLETERRDFEEEKKRVWKDFVMIMIAAIVRV